jgi:hypothetical protein
MAAPEEKLEDVLQREGGAVAGAVLASLTPRMVGRLGGVAESTIEALDLLTSPEIVTLLSSIQHAAPILTQFFTAVAELQEPGTSGDPDSIGAKLAAAWEEAGRNPHPLMPGELLHLPADPAFARAVRFVVGFLNRLMPETRKESPEPARRT